MLTAAGFESVEPDRLTFRQQAELFREAGCVVAQCGAALGNLYLTPPGCLVIPFVARSQHVNYRYFHHLATILGHRMIYIAGEVEHCEGRHSSHTDFRVDPEDLAKTLRTVAKEHAFQRIATGQVA